MPRKKSVVSKPKIKNSLPPIANGLGDALGFGAFGGQGGFPGGFGAGQPVEGTGTLFTNLRYELVSNMRQVLSQAFVEIGLVQTICVVPVDDGLRGGIMIKSKQLDEEEIRVLQLSVERDGDLISAGWAAKWERLYGGGGIMILVDDQDPEEPLDIQKIGPETGVEFRAADLWELFWDKQNVEGFNPAVQDSIFEWYSYYSEKIHQSRVLRLKGLMAPSFVRPRLRGWGVSVVETLVRSMNQYLKATSLGFEVLDEFKLDVFKLKNLVNTLVQPGGTQKVQARVQLANYQKNYQNAIVMDSEDDFDHKQLSFAGLAEAMAGIRMQVAADMRMPITKLFGTSVSAGIGNTDQNDMENYNSMVESEVRSKLKFHILTMLEIKCQKLFGYIPTDIEIEFKPLRELSALDQEVVKTGKFTRLIQAKAAGELTTEEFRDACNKGNLFDVQLDTSAAALGEIEQEKDDKKEESEKEVDKDEPGVDKEESRQLPKKEDSSQKPRFPVKNSGSFDRASYEADGGDEWISDSRARGLLQLDHITKDPKFVSILDEVKDQRFALWLFQKGGGKL